MAGVVIRRREVHFPFGRHEAVVAVEFIEEFIDIASFGGERLALFRTGVVPVMAVVFEHRTAAGDVDDHPIDVVEGGDIGIGESSSRLARTGMQVNRPAALLRARNDDVATVLLQHPGRRPMRLAEHHVGHATGEKRDPRTTPSDRRQELRQRRFFRELSGERVNKLSQSLRQQIEQPQTFGERQQSQFLRELGRRESKTKPIRVGKQAEENVAMKPILVLRRPFVHFFHRHAERLDQFAVLHARRAGRLARAAVEAELQMSAHMIVQRQPAIGDRPHQIDPSPRTVVLVAGFDVRRARRRAKPAMDAIQEQTVVDARAGILGNGSRCRRSGDDRQIVRH